MQVLKENVRLEILRKAGREFRQKSFRGASMRAIAGQAGMTVGNIYCYFASKDELYRELLAPIVGKIELMKLGLRVHHERTEKGSVREKAEHDVIVETVYGFIYKNREDLKLLLSGSGGSSLENYFAGLIRWYGNLYRQSLQEAWQEMGNEDLDISETTIYLVAKSVAESLVACIMNDFSLSEAKKIAVEMFAFYEGGSQSIIMSKMDQKLKE
jgi:AcrR family transcriptional regulator